MFSCFIYIHNDAPFAVSHMQVGLNRADCKRTEYLIHIEGFLFRPALVQRWHGGRLKLVLIWLKLSTGLIFSPCRVNPGGLEELQSEASP